MEAPSISLYVLVASHPCIAAELMLDRKRLSYRRVELPAVVSRALLRTMRFPRPTVPALRLGRQRVQGSREISRVLEELHPDPPLFPSRSGLGDRVEEAERWGEEVFQDAARRIEVWGLRRDRSGVEAQLRAATLPVPPRLGARLSGPALRLYQRITGASQERIRRDLADLPAMLDQIDGWIRDGVLSAEEPNAATFQIAPSVRLLMTMEDLRPMVETRPAGSLARRLVPEYPSRLGAGALAARD